MTDAQLSSRSRVSSTPRASRLAGVDRARAARAVVGQARLAHAASSITMDVRPGGGIPAELGRRRGRPRDAPRAVYREVVAPERLVFARPATATVTLTDLGDGRTEMNFHTTIETTDGSARRPRAGCASAFDRLAEQLETTDHEQGAPHEHPDHPRHRRRLRHRSRPTTSTAAMEFYGDVLGLAARASGSGRTGAGRAPSSRPARVTIALIASGASDIEFQPNTVPVAFRVDDVEAARAELESRGVRFAADTSTAASATWRTSRTPTATR